MMALHKIKSTFSAGQLSKTATWYWLLENYPRSEINCCCVSLSSNPVLRPKLLEH